eukprot:169738_1
MAVFNDNNQNNLINSSDENNDWGDAEEVNTYTQSFTKENEDLSKHDKVSNEWICHNCNYSNSRLSATHNDFKCIKCNAKLIINKQMDEEKKYQHDDITSQINNDEAIAKLLQSEPTIDDHTKHHKTQSEQKYDIDIYDSNTDKIKNKQQSVMENASELMLPDDISRNLLPIWTIKMSNENNNNKQHIGKSPKIASVKRTQSNSYLPSLFNGIYGSFCYNIPFSAFKFPSNEIKVNITKTKVQNINIQCKGNVQ